MCCNTTTTTTTTNPSSSHINNKDNNTRQKLKHKRKKNLPKFLSVVVICFVSTQVTAICCAFEIITTTKTPQRRRIIIRPSTSFSSIQTNSALHSSIKPTSAAETEEEEEIKKDIEYATHDSSDKLLLSSDIIGGSINITSIEDKPLITTTTTTTPASTTTANGYYKNGYPKNGKNLNNGISQTNGRSQNKEEEKKGFTIRQLWKKRHARSIEEGIRRESSSASSSSSITETSTTKLSSLLKTMTHNSSPPPSSSSSSPSSSSSSSDDDSASKSKQEQQEKTRRIRSTTPTSKRKFGARTIAGLIVALAEEADGLDVEVDARRDTPLWGKHVDAVTINFTRLGFKPLRMGGLDQAIRDFESSLPTSEKNTIAYSLSPTSYTTTQNNKKGKKQKKARPPTADEAFERIDVDKSGALDQEELSRALNLAAGIDDTLLLQSSDELNTNNNNAIMPFRKAKTKELLSGLASRLINLYDANGDGVVDRQEYQSMVEDMAALRRAQKQRAKQRELEKMGKIKRRRRRRNRSNNNGGGWRRVMGKAISTGLKRIRGGQLDLDEEEEVVVNGGSGVDVAQNYRNAAKISAMDANDAATAPSTTTTTSSSSSNLDGTKEEDEYDEEDFDLDSTYDLANDPSLLRSVTRQGEGSIVLSDLKLDLRRLLFGAVPFVKKITPGGPLILEPFTMTATASFTREDIMESNLLDAGLRRLVARALSRRVRSLRDLLDGAVFYGRTWNFASKDAPYVEVPKLENVEFDDKGRIIITGRARVRAKPGAPFVDNAFKLRTRIGTREDGQVIRLQDPEIALVLECPKAWERNIVSACHRLNLPVPTKPKPIYRYIPLVSPVKKNDKDGFNLGDDNKIKSIEVKNGALCFEVSAVLRPGRFLGNHFLAFSVPNRSFIITLDRVREGMRVARKNKRARKAAMRAVEAEARRGAGETYNAIMAQSLATDKAVLDSRDDLKFVDPDEEMMESKELLEPAEDENEKKGFLGRFVEGYLSPEDDNDEEANERMFAAISEWFGRQDGQTDDDEDDYDDDEDYDDEDVEEDDITADNR